ncbi:MAG: BMC domain-containing protein [Clostridia bacterium]|nr:BMC domain-containing protein [Clostridia bacterium]
MSSAIGMVEYQTVSTGVQAADLMVKTSEVDIIEAQTVCPGKYIVIIKGDLSAVKASVESSKSRFGDGLIGSFVLGNPHESIFPAIYGAVPVGEVNALGVLETFNASEIIVAADVAAKTAVVDLIELRIARGMCGKSYMFITGEVAAVTAAIEKAKMAVGEKGMYLNSSVIPRPDKKLWESIL